MTLTRRQREVVGLMKEGWVLFEDTKAKPKRYKCWIALVKFPMELKYN